MYERIEEVERKIERLETSALILERDYWKKKAEGLGLSP